MSRREAIAALTAALGRVDGTCSITVVGSFADGDDLSAVSDIDTIVVFDALTPSRFSQAVAAVAALSGDALGFPGRTVRVNSRLGPLKCDEPGEVVVHLMLYDRASHREHVLRSPFTCLDWERSQFWAGARLSDVYPVGALQPGDFLGARRGLANYVNDLQSGTLSIRQLTAKGDTMVEVADRVPLDRRHQGEYAYHIVRNLVVNMLKMRTGRNVRWDEEALRRDWSEHLPDLAAWLPFYDGIRGVKIARGRDFPPDTLARTREFLDGFLASFERATRRAFRLRLVRHARTALNDGTFLGRRDPPVAESIAMEPLRDEFDTVYSSPLRRAVDTARALAPRAAIQVDQRLIEIDYGHAEGLTPDELRRRFPETAGDWDRGEDAAFPGGEGTTDVLRRARAFLGALAGSPGRALAVTHNVVLRAIAADLLGLDLRRAHRIPIAHLAPLDVCCIGGRWLPDWGTTVKAGLLDGFVGWPS